MLRSRLEGEVTLEGVPVVIGDGSTLGFEKLDYTIGSKNELLAVAAWLLRPVVIEQLRLTFSLDSLFRCRQRGGESSASIEVQFQWVPAGHYDSFRLQWATRSALFC